MHECRNIPNLEMMRRNAKITVKFIESIETWLVDSTCYTKMEALQLAPMKNWIGQAGILDLLVVPAAWICWCCKHSELHIIKIRLERVWHTRWSYDALIIMFLSYVHAWDQYLCLPYQDIYLKLCFLLVIVTFPFAG